MRHPHGYDIEAGLRFIASGLDYHRRLLDRWLPDTGVVGDIGCGQGRVAVFYDRPGRRVIGVDSDPTIVAAANRHGHGNFVVASAFALPFADHSLAAYVGLGIIAEARDDTTPDLDPLAPARCLAEASRVVAASGILYISVPFRNLPRRLGASASWNEQLIPSFSAGSIRDLVLDAGFEALVLRESSLAWGLGPLRRAASLARMALVREDEAAQSYRILFPVLRHFANSLVVIARRR